MLVRHVAGLHRADHPLLDDTLAYAHEADTHTILTTLAPTLTEAQRTAIAAHTVFAHAACLVCPESIDALIDGLRDTGLTVDDPVDSTVVRDRLATRHGVPPASLTVKIIHIHVPNKTGTVELFALETPPGEAVEAIAARERLERNESHVALGLDTPDDVLITGLRTLLTEHAGLTEDGGGHNPREQCTVLYFRNQSTNQRLELRINGLWTLPQKDPAHQLLSLMTGAWTTQAIAVAADLGVADELPASIPTLAQRLSVNQDGLTRLLRHLASQGVVATRGDEYTLTATGEPLRRDAPHSMRPLAQLYGGPFYRSFGALAYAVRTGDTAFDELYGAHHFDYFAQHPALAALFDSAMAASAPMFEPVPELLDLTDATTVVDVAGGNGELLAHILGRTPHLRGILFEREHVLGRAKQRMTEAGCADRCDLLAGDFTEGVPTGGDVYLLSRVLHDWDDEQCLAILRHCAASMADGAQLVLVERLLPTTGAPSLAVAWDLHMLCNVGGRERTLPHYTRLLAEAGFDLAGVTGLPLDGNLLQARRRRTS